jgi:hypothetical protein
MIKLTGKKVRHVANALASKYRAPWITKSHPFVKVLEVLLELMGLDVIEGSVSKWLNKWSISLKRFVYFSFTPGGRKLPILVQLGIVCHEYTHARRQKKDRRFFPRYVGRTSYRCQYEVEAIKAQMEIVHWLGGRIVPEAAVDALRAYGLTKADRRVALKQLRYYDKHIVQKGRMAQAVAKEIKKILLA